MDSLQIKVCFINVYIELWALHNINGGDSIFQIVALVHLLSSPVDTKPTLLITSMRCIINSSYQRSLFLLINKIKTQSVSSFSHVSALVKSIVCPAGQKIRLDRGPWGPGLAYKGSRRVGNSNSIQSVSITTLPLLLGLGVSSLQVTSWSLFYSTTVTFLHPRWSNMKSD